MLKRVEAEENASQKEKIHAAYPNIPESEISFFLSLGLTSDEWSNLNDQCVNLPVPQHPDQRDFRLQELKKITMAKKIAVLSGEIGRLEAALEDWR